MANLTKPKCFSQKKIHWIVFFAFSTTGWRKMLIPTISMFWLSLRLYCSVYTAQFENDQHNDSADHNSRHYAPICICINTNKSTQVKLTFNNNQFLTLARM